VISLFEGERGPMLRRIALIAGALVLMVPVVMILLPGGGSTGAFRSVSVVPEPHSGDPIPSERPLAPRGGPHAP